MLPPNIPPRVEISSVQNPNRTRADETNRRLGAKTVSWGNYGKD